MKPHDSPLSPPDQQFPSLFMSSGANQGVSEGTDPWRRVASSRAGVNAVDFPKMPCSLFRLGRSLFSLSILWSLVWITDWIGIEIFRTCTLYCTILYNTVVRASSMQPVYWPIFLNDSLTFESFIIRT
jgi:hypothetical protein